MLLEAPQVHDNIIIVGSMLPGFLHLLEGSRVYGTIETSIKSRVAHIASQRFCGKSRDTHSTEGVFVRIQDRPVMDECGTCPGKDRHRHMPNIGDVGIFSSQRPVPRH